jgi:Xaa-Pro aminopeptidase
MEKRGFDRFFLYQPENFAWLTGGGDCTVATGEGEGFLEVSTNRVRLHVSQIESSRLAEEEKGEFEAAVYPWYSPPPAMHPSDLDYDLTPLRLVLSAVEQKKYRALCRDAAVSLEGALRMAETEWTELQLAGELARRMRERNINPIVLLVAGAERVFRYRHPLPKNQPLGRLTMGVVCGRRDGLVANLTRMRSWGTAEVAALYEDLLYVEAQALSASAPGATVGDVLDAIRDGYRGIGQSEAFAEHHQGGIAGYRTREILAVPKDDTRLLPGMCVAWNPSLPGAKVEDTFLLTKDGLQNLTYSPDWPTLTVDGRQRPAIFAG